MRERTENTEVLLMQESNVAVNPQGTDIDLAYLAGLWDGEGYIGVICSKSRRRAEYRISLGITNTNPDILAEVARILDKYEISARVETAAPTKPEKHKISYCIAVSKLSSAKILCELLIPYLKGKRGIAILVLRYVNSRLKYAKRTPFNEEEISLYEQIKRLNKKGPSETTRATPIGEDIVHPI